MNVGIGIGIGIEIGIGIDIGVGIDTQLARSLPRTPPAQPTTTTIRNRATNSHCKVGGKRKVQKPVTL